MGFKLKTFLKQFGKGLINDLIGITGLALLWYGLNLFSEVLAPVVIGMLLIWYAVKATD